MLKQVCLVGEEEPFPGIDPALSMPDLDAHAQARVQLQSGSQPDSPPRPDSPLLKQLHAVIEQAQAKTEHAQTGEHIHTQAPTEPSDPGLKPDEPPRKEMTKNEAFLTRIVQQRALKRDQKFMDKQVPLGERKLRRDRERDAARSASPKPEAERNEASQRTAERERAGEKEQRGGHTGPGAGAGLGRERAAGYWPERAFERRDQWQYGHHHVDERVREPHRDGSRDLRSGEAGRYQRFRAEEREGEYASGFGNGLARAHHYHDQRRWGGDSYRPRQRDTYRPRDSYRPYSLAEEKTRDWDQRQGRPRDQDGSGGRQ